MVREVQSWKERAYTPGEKRELALANEEGISLLSFLEEGYDADQLDGIRYALEIDVDIRPYLRPDYCGACIKEIAIGLKQGLDVSFYADLHYSWRKMREIRLGMIQNLDIGRYRDPLYSYWQMREIRLGLKAGLDVSYYDNFMYTAKEMRKRRLILKSRKNSPDLSGDWTVLSGEGYDLCISPDKLKVYLNWHCKREVNDAEELEKILKENGISCEVDRKALETVVQESRTITEGMENDHSIPVARGKTPEDGKDGFYEWMFRPFRKRSPKLKEDGTIDFDSMRWFDFVRKGQVLAVYHFAEAGCDGVNVFGERIPAKIGREKETLGGRGFEILPDLRTYAASADGYVSLKNQELIVDGMLVMDQLDHSAEPLSYDGDVYIRGNIEGPVTLEVSGDLVVEGSVQKAQIRCGGSLILKGGINNSFEQVELYVGGCVISRFFENVTLHAIGNIYFGTSLNSNLYTYGEVVSYGKKGGIIGGNSYSEKGFCVTNLGNEAGMHTSLNLGGNEDIRSLLANTQSEIREIKAALTRLMNARNHISHRQKMEKKTAEDLIARIGQTIAEKENELKNANRRMEDVIKRSERACRSQIVVEHQVHDNVQIQYSDQKITAVPSSQVQFKIHKDAIVMEKLFGSQKETA